MFTARPLQKPRKAYNPNVLCDFCHMKGHLKFDCLKLLKCDFYHKTGHLKGDCYRLIGYLPHYKGKRDVAVAGNSTYDAGPDISQHYYPHMPPSSFQQSQYQHVIPF
ncbi:hypothetical protein H5410_061657 [Solanum commersonii]|uniref:Uncharacterized protein n=1 Tax=Solanum commersonii TaxID=4109 RepID=A0A9J5W8B2_SOLCO|nr:hypothetical protein H5410_061657 [Solanum commersonii]